MSEVLVIAPPVAVDVIVIPEGPQGQQGVQGIPGDLSSSTIPAGTPTRNVLIADLLGPEGTMGALASGVFRTINFDKRFTAATDDATSTGLDMRNLVISTEFSGANSAYEVVGLHLTPNFYHDAGTAPTLTFGYGIKQACRIGLADNLNGSITTFRGIETHAAIEGHNVVGSLFNFNVGDFDWINGDGTVGQLVGYRVGNLTGDGGHLRVTTRSVCIEIGEQTGGAPLTAGLYSSISAGTNKYFIYTAGSAPSVHSGRLRVGSNSPSPTDTLEVVGFLKAGSVGGWLTAGSYHELQSTSSGITVTVSNSHASTPRGLRINFSAASPNNETQTFLLCDDGTTTRLQIFSNGTVKTKGKLLCTDIAGGIGYDTGTGGTVTQASTKGTAVNLNRLCGEVTMNAAALAAATIVSFTMNNTSAAAGDRVIVNHVSGGTLGAYGLNAVAAAGTITFYVRNNTAGSLSEAIVLGFAIVKGATS